jgi:hypothetical protein
MATTVPTTRVPAPFTWRGEHLTADLGHGATVLFTTRRGGVSAPPFDSLNLGRWTDDDPAAVDANRVRLGDLVGAPIAQGRQVHGAVVERVTALPDGEPRESDGQATALPGVAALVLTADCLAVALVARGAVAMVHAGWRGLADGILEEGVRALREVGGDGPPTAAIGPAAGGCCYEVGDEVREALGQAPAGGPAPIDLKTIARERLQAAGAVEVHDVGLCTMCGDDRAGSQLFFSHRRDRGRTGRQAGVVWRSSPAA